MARQSHGGVSFTCSDPWMPCFSSPAIKPIVSDLNHPSRPRVPICFRPGRCMGLIAAAWLVLLTGCASERSIQQHDATGPSIVASAVDSSACRAHEPTPLELAKQRSAIDPLRVPGLYSELFHGRLSDSSAAMSVGGMRLRRHKKFDHPDRRLVVFLLVDDATAHALMVL